MFVSKELEVESCYCDSHGGRLIVALCTTLGFRVGRCYPKGKDNHDRVCFSLAGHPREILLTLCRRFDSGHFGPEFSALIVFVLTRAWCFYTCQSFLLWKVTGVIITSCPHVMEGCWSHVTCTSSLVTEGD